MKVSRNGQISIPAAVRARWRTERVTTVDMGSHLLVRPLSDDPVADLLGKYAAIDSTDAKPSTRADDEIVERAKRRRS